MLKKVVVNGMLAALLLGMCQAGYAVQAEKYEHLLKAADIEKTVGLKGLQVVPRDPSKGATGMLNFADAKGTVVFTATFEIIEPAAFKKSKSSAGWKNAFKGPVAKLGDEAYSGPKTGDQFILAFKKGKNWITLTSGFNFTTMKPLLTLAQIKAVAKIVLSRL